MTQPHLGEQQKIGADLIVGPAPISIWDFYDYKRTFLATFPSAELTATR